MSNGYKNSVFDRDIKTIIDFEWTAFLNSAKRMNDYFGPYAFYSPSWAAL